VVEQVTTGSYHLATFHRLRQLAPEATMLSFDRRILDAL